MVWNGKWNETFGMEHRRCRNGMEDNLPHFHTRFHALHLQKNIYCTDAG